MVEKTRNPIFIVGVPRSGTTLLRVLLDSHSQIAAGPEAGWITGDYTEASIMGLVDVLIDDPLGLVKNFPGTTADQVRRAAGRLLMDLFEPYQAARGKPVLVLKTPNDIAHLAFLKQLMPGAKYIHILRDGRDVALSTVSKKGTFFSEDTLGDEFGPLNFGNALRRWMLWERDACKALGRVKSEVFNLNYEGLVAEPGETMSKLCEFLGLPYEKHMLEFAKLEHEYPSWEAGSTDVKATKKVVTSSVMRWQRELSAYDVVTIPAEINRYLVDRGYPDSKASFDDKYLKIARTEQRLRRKSQADLKSEIANITSSLAESDARIEHERGLRLTGESSQMLSELATVREQLANDREIYAADNSAMKAELELLKERDQEKVISLQLLDAEKLAAVAELGSTSGKLNERDSELKALSQDMQSLKGERLELAAELAASEAKISEQQTLLRNSQEALQERETQLQELGTAQAELKTQLSELQTHLGQKAEETAKLGERLDHGHQALRHLRTEREKLTAAVQAAGAEITRITDHLEIVQAESTQHQGTITKLLSTNNAQKNQLQYQLQAARSFQAVIAKQEQGLWDKEQVIQNILQNRTWKAARLAIAPAVYLRNKFKRTAPTPAPSTTPAIDLRPEQSLERPGDVSESITEKIPEVPETKVGTSRKVNLGEQVQEYFGAHRSGWAYAVQNLAGIHDPNGIFLDTFIERTFAWEGGKGPIIQPWIGIIHVPPTGPDWFLGEQSNEAIFQSDYWQASKPACQGLFCMSNYHMRHLQKHLDLPIEPLIHPTQIPEILWSPERFKANRKRKVVQIGWWLRILHSIYELPKTKYEKIFLRPRNDAVFVEALGTECELHTQAGSFKPSMRKSVIEKEFISNEDYDRLLSENVVFMNLYDASANNAVIECIVRNTPLLINPIDPVIEYLGAGYPLYFSTLDEAAEKLASDELVLHAHDYLKNHPIKKKLTGAYFRASIENSKILRTSLS